LRTKYFHGVSSGNQHPYLLKSRYGRVSRLLISIMDAIYEKAIQTLYKGQSKKLTELTTRLEDLRIKKDGGYVQRYPQGWQLVIYTLADR
jgi:hypothetical protein